MMLVAGLSGPVYAQIFDGPTQVCPNLVSGVEYSYEDDVEYSTIEWWSAGGATIISRSGLSCKATFTSDGSVTIKLYNRFGTKVVDETREVILLQPGTISGPSSVCNGSSATISSPGGAGSSFVWKISTDGGTTFSSVNGQAGYTLVHTPAVTTQYRRYPAGCKGALLSNTITVTVNSPPSINLSSSIPDEICISSSEIILAATPSGGLWQLDSTPNSSTIDPSSLSLGFHTIKYIAGASGCTSEATKAIKILDPLPPPNKTLTTDYGAPLKIAFAKDSDESFQWHEGSTNGTVIFSGSIFKTPPVTSESTYYVGRVLDSLDNCESSARATVVVSPGPENNYNFVREELIQKSGIDDSVEVAALTVEQKSMTTKYVDGLGRPIQTVQWRANPEKYDLVQPIEYDFVGREATKYLPYSISATNGYYRQLATIDDEYENSEQALFYNGLHPNIPADSSPFSVARFEASALNRVIEQGAFGVTWQPGTDHTVRRVYRTNEENEVLLFDYDIIRGLSTNIQFYVSNELFCTEMVDEQQHIVLEFVDKMGKTICKKVKGPNEEYACTYYVYDNLDNLVAVLPPEAVKKFIKGN